jgi:hypothetical protein
MVAPITGPFLPPGGAINTVTYYQTGSCYRQAVPHSLPLLYLKNVASGKADGTASRDALYVINSAHGPAFTDAVDWASNVAFSRFRDAIHEGADLGVDLAEGGQSMGMMGQRFGQMFGFGKDLLRGNFLGAARRLNLAVVPKGVSAKKSLANNWLEYHFGWEPLIKDIFAVIDVLQNPIKSVRPRGVGKTFSTKRLASGTPPDTTVEEWQCQHRVACGAEVTISNPNLFLAQNLGLVNPAGIAWELVPFSFVLDWFVNVGDFLSQGTDLLGLSVTNAWTTIHSRSTMVSSQKNQFWNPPFALYRGSGVEFERRIGLPGISLKVRPWRIWGWQRGVTAGGLLIQQLEGIGGKRH